MCVNYAALYLYIFRTHHCIHFVNVYNRCTNTLLPGKKDADWETRWQFDAFWDVLYLGILVPIMLIWRPNKSAQGYVYKKAKYAAVRGEDPDQEEYGQDLQEAQEGDSFIAAVLEDKRVVPKNA